MNVPIRTMPASSATIQKRDPAHFAFISSKSKNVSTKGRIFFQESNPCIGNSNSSFPVRVLFTYILSDFRFRKINSMRNREFSSSEEFRSFSNFNPVFLSQIPNSGFSATKRSGNFDQWFLENKILVRQCFFINKNGSPSSPWTEFYSVSMQLSPNCFRIKTVSIGDLIDREFFINVKFGKRSFVKRYNSHNSIISFFIMNKMNNGANSANVENRQCRASKRDYERLSGRVWRSGVINIIPVNVPTERYDMTRTSKELEESGNRKPEITLLLIVNISPVDTPVLSMTESVKAYNVLHEWQTQALKTPTAVARIEGDDANIKTVTPTVRLNNNTQIIDNNFIVSETQQAINSAGRSSEEAFQTELAMKELANDIEYAYVINSAAVTGASGTARQLKGLVGWVVTNISSATANRALTSTILDALLKTVWLAGGKPDVILTGGSQKIAFTNTTNFPGMTRNINANMGGYYLAVDVYQGGIGGEMKLVTSTIMGNNKDNQIFCLQMDKFRKAWLRPIKKVALGKTGDGNKFQIVAETTLESLNEKASGVITQLS